MGEPWVINDESWELIEPRREAELVGDSQAGRDYERDVALGAIPPLPVWAGEGVDLITDLRSAADLVAELATRAEEALTRAGRR